MPVDLTARLNRPLNPEDIKMPHICHAEPPESSNHFLLKAVVIGNSLLLKKCAWMDKTNALIEAVAHDRIGLLSHLLSYGADESQVCEHSRYTPLAYADLKNKKNAVKALLDEIKDLDLIKSLNQAFQFGYMTVADVLLDKINDSDDQFDVSSLELLSEEMIAQNFREAARRGHVLAITALYQLNPNINDETISAAISGDQISLLKYLIEEEFINLESQGDALLEATIRLNSETTLKLLVSKGIGPDQDQLEAIAKNGTADMYFALEELGFDLSASYGDTSPAFWANLREEAFQDRLKSLRVQPSFNTHRKSNRQSAVSVSIREPPLPRKYTTTHANGKRLFNAAKRGESEEVERLLQKIDFSNWALGHALKCAVQSGNLETVQLLSSKHLGRFLHKEMKKEALEVAIENQSSEIIKEILLYTPLDEDILELFQSKVDVFPQILDVLREFKEEIGLEKIAE